MINKLIISTLLTFLLNELGATRMINNQVYDTSSGLYRASIVEVKNSFDMEAKPNYIHKLVGVHYAEKPKRFERPIMRNYEERDWHNDPKKPVVCYQSVNMTTYGLFFINQIPEMSEDCLTISLYIPVSNNTNEPLKNLSVVIHIHGGSNMVGGAVLFDGSVLAAHGQVIVALINFRLSILGFVGDMTDQYPGNYGLHDQIMAIKWLRKNCEVLNCNPESITLWGHSAGSGDVNWLALSPYSNKLFQRAIIQVLFKNFIFSVFSVILLFLN
jgi:carboxylesterase type B